jgi:site-specific recombinase XerD
MARDDLKQLRTDYLEYLEIERNRSNKTIENYGRYLGRFITFSNTKGVQTANDMDDELVRQYRLYLNRLKDPAGQPLKRVTQNYHIIALRNFLKYLVKRNVKAVAPEKVELGKQEDREVTFLEQEELKRLLEAPKGNDMSAARDRAILNTLFSTGMRVSELCSLDRGKIDLNRGEISIRGKGGKIRVVFLSEETRQYISQYLDTRKDADLALWIRDSKKGVHKEDNLRLSCRSIQRLVKKYAIHAGIVGKKVSPHTVRHSYATDLLRNGADIRSVQALLGHSSVTTTQIYTHVTDKQLREVHEKFHDKK